MVKKWEGCRLEAYRCAAGVWTIGYGHTKGVAEGMRISQAEAERMLAEDLVRYERSVRGMLKVSQSDRQVDALVSLAYNIGVGALQRSTLLKKINGRSGDEAIKAEWMRWDRAGGKVLAGLKRRREDEVRHYCG